MMWKDDPAIKRIRETRHRISQDHEHDPQKLVNYYIELQKQYSRDDSVKEQQTEPVQTESIGGKN